MTSNTEKHSDTIIIGGGAAGMMCAAFAASTGKKVLVIEHTKSAGEKIRISGGGRCNFTNLRSKADNFISQNKHFAKSALKRYTQHDFVKLVDSYKINWHEKSLGQLFCDVSAKQIISLLLDEMEKTGAKLRLQTSVLEITKLDCGFQLTCEKEGSRETLTCDNLVVACGGKSIPKMGATGFGYAIAEQFGHEIVETRPALVPLTFGEDLKAKFAGLSGISADAEVACQKTKFKEALLFTHRGISGPAILQISSYWRETMPIKMNLTPGISLFEKLQSERSNNGRQSVHTVLSYFLPKALAQIFSDQQKLTGNLADQSDKKLRSLCASIQEMTVQPVGTEGYRTAEVTLGGVNTDGLSSTTMESKNVPGLYFIGEVVDVTGWLGGYNFQWAWSSGWAAGMALAEK